MSVRTLNQAKPNNPLPRQFHMRLRPVCHAIALMLAAGATVNAHAATNLANIGAQMNAARNAAAASGMTNLGVSPQQALKASQPSIQNLAHAAQGIAQQIAAQQAAAAAGWGAASNVPNGLTVGGLQLAPGVNFDSNGAPTAATSNLSNPNLWVNANAPTQSVASNGHVTVDVTQTGQSAVATWQTMNVGSNTTLNFNQSGGTQTNGANNWVILNRIMDPSGRPSQILGNVNAQGTVLVINRNGILFGAGSQVNVHSLLASSLDLLNANDDLVQTSTDIENSNSMFVNGGLAALNAGISSTGGSNSANPVELLGLGNNVSVSSANAYQAPGDITIAPGASITTSADGSASNGGFVVIAAPNVNNGGSITVAPTGQVVLAAGVGVSLLPESTVPQVLFPELSGRITVGTESLAPDITPAGTLTNTGIIQADRGNINLLGSSVVQNGIVGVTTSVSTPGSINVSTVDEYIANTPTGTAYDPVSGVVTSASGATDTNRAGQLIFGNGSVTTVLPDTDGETATSAPGITFTPGSITITAGSVWFQSGSLIEAPGSSVSVAALTRSPVTGGDLTPPGDMGVQGRIYVDTGATIDVSGLANVELPISDILLDLGTINENQLADSPLLRDSFLNGLKGVVVDSTLSGTNADGLQWVGSPLLNLSGDVNLIPRSVDQLLTNGGTITLSGNEVMTADGSSLNLNGGYVHYLGGMVNTTRLVDSSGAIVSIGNANPNDTFVGIAGEFVESHPRWGITKDWFDPLLNGGAFEADFIVGGNAGTLNIFGSQDVVLDGNITAEAFGGSKQVQGDAQPSGGTFNLGGASLVQLTQGSSSGTSGEEGTVILQNSAPQLGDLATNSSAGFNADTQLDTTALGALSSTDPNNVLSTVVVPVNTLNSGGFSNVNITANPVGSNGIIVAADTQLAVQPGGSIKLTSQGAAITILGGLIASAGTISVSSGGGAGGIDVGPDALLSAAGQWVNNDSVTSADTVPGSSEYINGGSITLATTGTDPIVLQAGSTIDVSSGGELQSNGQLLMQNGIPEGMGGNVSLIAFSNLASQFPSGGAPSGPFTPVAPPAASLIEMDGTIRSEGFSGGGALTIQDYGFQIGGDPTQAPAWDIYLPADFFAQQGFGKYQLNALFDATVAPGAMVRLTQQNLIPDVPALQHAATGASLVGGSLTSVGVLDAYHRQATDLILTGGGGYVAALPPDGTIGEVSVGAGASIIGDAGASIGLGSPAQVTVLGSIIAPGGSITLSADSVGSGFAVPGQVQSIADQGFGGFTSPGKSVWLGEDAVLDVAGVALVNPLAAPVRSGEQTSIPDTGKVLPGGSVTISDDSGYVIAQAGSVIEVSGASANFEELQSLRGYAPQQVWSNAGSITLGAASGLLFDGTIQAEPGAAQAQGGALTILPEQNTGGVSTPASMLVLQQSGNTVPTGLMPGQSLVGAISPITGQAFGTSSGVLLFSIDRLKGSGIATLVIGGDPAVAGGQTPVPVVFSGNVNLTLSSAVEINTSQIVALSSAQTMALFPSVDPTTGTALPSSTLSQLLVDTPVAIGTTVTVDAPYVALSGPQNLTSLAPVQALADSTLDIHASFIDLVNQLQLSNFNQANFTSSGDIRLTSTSKVQGTQNVLLPGELFTPGNLTFKAADLYPSTGSTFILDAVGLDASGNSLPTTITFLANGASTVPLSAGGTLLVDATNIVQAGTVRAPAGSLIFGVGDTSDAATMSQFNGLPLVATDSVALANGSLTSVSLDGAIIPFGTTVDGLEWQFNPVPGGNAAPDLTAPPAKFVSVNGSSIALNAGATIDLSGGGDLQAEEWVPGTGGTRDLLSQYNVSFATTASGVAVPVNPGGGNVFAILPGKQSPVAAFDPIFAQTVQPSTNADGSVSTVTDSMGVGSASLNGTVGQSVYLSGVPGLPAGYYTLLPAKYATLPGAFRVTVSSASGALTPGSSQVLPDGTVAVAGFMGNTLSGSRSATPTLFDVQSGAVWQQYSQYTLTSANSFFPSLAASAGDVTPPLPMDAGQLVLAAKQGLTLGATLDTAAAPGGAPAEVDIASQAIQIVGSGEAALPGYLQLSAAQLDALDAGSLLIGGTRTQTTSGVSIDPIATSVVVSNDAAHPLTGPEVILVSANSLQVDAGSAIAAQGAYPAAKDQPISITANATTGTSDGALLSVTNGGDSVVTHAGTVNGTGLLTMGAGATLSGGQALTLDSSGNLTFNPAASLSGSVIAVDGSAITFTDQTGAAAANLPGFVAGPTQLAQLANANEVILRSAGTMTFDGTTDLTFGNVVDLSAGTFLSDGGSATINAPDITFSNEVSAPQTTVSSGMGTLTVNAGQINFGNGDATVAGFGSVTMNATAGIVAQGNGTLDFGALPVTLNAPVYLADTGSGSTIQTTGLLSLNGAAGAALGRVALGGAFSFIGGTVNDNGATISAPGGNVTMRATSGDLTINNGSTISSAGVALPFFDVIEYAPAGNIALTADAGTINVAAGSTLDFSGASGGGSAGSLSLAAPNQTVQLSGTIKGNAASGSQGGSFSLNTGGAVDLDNLADELASSGVNNQIVVQTRAGNLTLSAGNTLTANTVSLTADGGAGNASDTANGNVNINGTINANGVANAQGGAEGGTINLYGKSGVDVEGTLLAEGSDAYIAGAPTPTINPNSTELGGTINIGTAATPTAGSYNAQYGYENVALANSGAIKLGASASIDVSGGGVLTLASDGLEGGTVNLRAPLLSDAATNGGIFVNVTVQMTNLGSGIKGARAVDLEPYAVWSTTDSTTGAQHFDGIVDPAGWYQSAGPNATPQLVAGTFTDQSGNTIDYTPGTYDPVMGVWTGATLSNDPGASWAKIKSDLATDLSNDFFTPASTSATTSHQTFYGYLIGSTTSTGTDGSTTVVTHSSTGTTTTVTASDGTVTTTDSAPVPGTLMSFVQSGETGVVSQFAGNNVQLEVTPGIELDNPSSAINHGNISIVSNWNLDTGSSPTDPSFRFNGQAPVITFRAVNNVQVDASLTDGFFQIANPVNPGTIINVPSRDQFGTYNQDEPLYTESSGYFGTLEGFGLNHWVQYGLVEAPAVLTTGMTSEIAQYYALWAAYAQYLMSPIPPIGPPGLDWVEATDLFLGSPVGSLVPPTAPSRDVQASDPSKYLVYLAEYETYASASLAAGNFIATLSAPIGEPVAVIAATTVSSPSVVDNTPSPAVNSANPLPLLGASLAGGASSSYRVVAGANFGSANPEALQPTSELAAGGGNVTLDGHFAFVDANGLTVNAPTMVRTGTGSIYIAAANDVSLFDPDDTTPLAQIAPGVIYTAGEPTPGAPVGSSATLIKGNPSQGAPDVIISPTVSPEAAGNVSIVAQNDITGLENVVDATGAVSGVQNRSISQFWWEWMELGNPAGVVGSSQTTQTVQTSIDFGAFDQGVMSVGGNVSISAGGNISDLAVSLPTTWYLTSTNIDSPPKVTLGGGNLIVTAGGNILSGDYFVANGVGTITAGGQIGSDLVVANPAGQPTEVSTLLATQAGVLNVSARQGADIGGVFDPSLIESDILLPVVYLQQADGQGYSANSAVNIESTTGNVELGTLNALSFIGDDATPLSLQLPAAVRLTAFTGGITVASAGTLAASPVGNLSLIANQSISLNALNGTSTTLGMANEDSSLIDETEPVRIYSLTGSIVDGILESSGQHAGFYDDLLNVVIDKTAFIEAGQDIVNLSFQGQNLRDADVTRIVAGRDIQDTPLVADAAVIPSLQLGGPGYFDIEAGRNIGPLTNQSQEFDSLGVAAGATSGIDAVGNANNPALPHESANIQVLFGVGPGVDDADFIATYVNPTSSPAGIPSSTSALVAFMQQYDEGQVTDNGLQSQKVAQQKKIGTLDAATAWTRFQALPAYVQQLFVGQVFFSILTDVGNDFNNQSSPFFQQYARGFQAINTLFPAALGYTANDLTGGGNGANAPVQTGNLDIRSTTIQTQQGGNVSIFGPGGQALVGSSSAPPAIVSGGQVVAGPGTMGILTLEQGDIDIFTDRSLLLAQSRVFTEQGGDMTIWSSNGDIDAGKGSTSVADIPPPGYVCDVNHFCTVDVRGEVTGAGIATLQTIPGAAKGNVNLLAPRGTVDAGAAGIRVSGDLNVAALHVANTDNIQVQGKTTGVPTVATVDTGALTAATAATSAVTQMAQSLVRSNASGVPQRHWIISVQVEGFGDSNDDDPKKKHKPGAVSYEPSSAVSILGFGGVGNTQRAFLSKEEQSKLGKI
jgi:filamentous hemagglutinin family protein